MDPRFRLLLRRARDPQDWEAFIVSHDEPTPRSIPNTAVHDGWALSGFAPSPGGRWLVLDYTDPTGRQRSTWLSSFDGLDQWKVVTLDIASYPVAISEEEWVVVGVPEQDRLEGGPDWTETAPLARIDPFTGEMVPLPDLPDLALFDFYFSIEGQSHAVYHTFSDPPYQFLIFSYSEGRAIPAFQWLQGLGGWHRGTPLVYARRDALFAAQVRRSYGLDLALGLSLDQVLQQVSYPAVMRAIVLPGADSTDIETFVYDNVAPPRMALLRRSHLPDATEHLYVLDYETASVIEYCLDFSISGSIAMSPDGLLLATSIGGGSRADDPSPGDAALVLDTTNGYYAVMEGYSSVGWGIVEPDGQP